MNTPSPFTGTTEALLKEQPALTIDFYSYGILMTRRSDNGREQTYAVDPASLSAAAAENIVFNTGILRPETLLMRHNGSKTLIAEYRRPQITGLWLEGLTDALRIPLPGLLLFRVTTLNAKPYYEIYAVKRRPKDTSTLLYHCPLPNTSNSGSICWGTVPTVSEASLASHSLAADWKILLGSPYGNHQTHNKSLN
ncbi:MAG: hypothetical protein ABI700_00915, partial [Chloroflexota bacterium]